MRAALAIRNPLRDGNLYIADSFNHRVRKVEPLTGIITTVAGSGECCFSGDGGLATDATFNQPTDVGLDTDGNLYIADRFNQRVRKVNASTGTITTFAGNGACCFSGDGGPATSAQMDQPVGIGLDANGNVYIADRGNLRVRRVDTSGTITTVAGNGSCCFSGDGGAATDAGLGRPWDVAFDSDGNMFIADAVDRIRKVDTSGVITTAAISSFGTPNGVAVDASGDVFVSENFSNRIGMVDASTQVITRVVGSIPPGFSGDGGLETDALMSVPLGLDLDGLGNLFIAEWGNDRIRRVDAFTGIITTVAGNGTPTGSIDGEGGDPTDDLGDGGPAVDASLFDPFDVVADSSGNLYLADFGNHRIRKVDTSGIITTVAGTGVAGFSGDGGPATEAQLNGPTGLAFDHSGNIYIADWTDYRIRKIEAATGIITTVAGNGSRGFSGDGDRATDASLIPTDLAVDAFGNLFIADYNNGRVGKVDTDGIITTYAGNGDCYLAGDDGLATSAAFSSPVAVVLDPAGDLFISDIWTHRIRKVVAASGIVVAVSGSGPTDFFDGGYSGDGGPATSATHAGPVGIAIDPSGNLLIADQNSHVVRMVEGVAAARCDLDVGLNFADGITTWTFVVGAGEPSTWSTSVILLGNDIPLWSIDLPTLPPITISFSFPIPPIGVIEVRSTLAVDGGGCTTSDSVDTGL